MNKRLRNLKVLLDEQIDIYNRPEFIPLDPISIPHRFTNKEDIEISAFFAASFAWGQRVTIINKTNDLMERMDNAPFDFILNHDDRDLKRLLGFVHRTFNDTDLFYFIEALRNIYKTEGGLENAFSIQNRSAMDSISAFRRVFLQYDVPHRTQKHISDPERGASAKRLNMYLRWMVRKDKRGVDFGIWKKIEPSVLSIPLDVHTGNIARSLGLLSREQNDRKAVEELDSVLRLFDPEDPVKYDFALFGMGALPHFK